ncbi:MAG: thiamine-phosphate kinase [Candidatus Planktophila sp.]|jgi:thiamine-monophosphate kinase|tara:strand:+ start:1158 stop:2087 length:930 start_codon:yes stop_codon:yes gene_type:complete
MGSNSQSYTEAQVIARLREIFKKSDPRLEVGIGDDAAVVAGSARQVMTTDMAVEGVHFRTDWSSPFEIGRKVAAANSADILAMGALPNFLLVAVALTGREDLDWIEELARGIKDEADLAGFTVIGGDISRSEKIVITISAIGSCERAITRDGARVGDGIYLSSLTGWSAAGLSILENLVTATTKAQEKALQEYKAPSIDYKFDTNRATALCDISDSLIEQATQLSLASEVKLEFNIESISKVEEFAELESVAVAMGVDIWQWIFGGGEDHALLATGQGLPGLLIGKVVPGSGLAGVPSNLKVNTWNHFG